jgi:hypothetical protein
MRQLGRTVSAFTFLSLVAAFLAHAQGTPVRSPAWAKVCENVSPTSKNADGGEVKTVRICMTVHERIGGNGTLIVGAALQEIEGREKKHLLVAMAPDLQPVMRDQMFPRDAWDRLQTKGKLDNWEEAGIKELKFGSTSCNAFACAAEIEATPALISDLEVSGGLLVFATNPSGTTVAAPVPLVDFAQTLAGPPADTGARASSWLIVCAVFEWRGCSMKPIHEWKK